MGIAVAGIKDLILEHCRENDVEMPEGFNADFDKVFGEVGEIKHLTDLRTKLCRKLKEALKDPELKERNEDLAKEIIEEIRLKLASKLNFEDIVTASRGGKPSIRELLKKYTASLKPGETWNAESLKLWGEDEKIGRRLVSRVYTMVPWTEASVRMILGAEANGILAQNPFERGVEIKIRSKRQARKLFLDFFKTLKSKQKWTISMLEEWKGSEINGVEVTGLELRHWVKNNIGNFHEESIKTVLGDEAKKALKRNPLQKERMTNIKEAGKKLRKWIRDNLEEGQEWCMNMVQETAGHKSLIPWIREHVGNGEVTLTVIRKVLGSNATKILRRNPFVIHNIHIRSRADVRRGFEAFYKSLADGQEWTTYTLKMYTDGPVPGVLLLQWVNTNCRKPDNSGPDWNSALDRFATAEERARNPKKTNGEATVSNQLEAAA